MMNLSANCGNIGKISRLATKGRRLALDKKELGGKRTGLMLPIDRNLQNPRRKDDQGNN